MEDMEELEDLYIIQDKLHTTNNLLLVREQDLHLIANPSNQPF